MRKFLAVVAAFALLSAPALAQAHHHKKPRCKPGYVAKRVWGRHHKRKVWRCEKRKLTLAAPKISYKAIVDPTFTQAPTDPLAVTYAYSADATSITNGVTTDLGTTGQLPAGVLNFYSSQTPGGPEALYCSMNVAGTVTGGSCPITYQQTGAYDVTTQYIPNAAAATTQTETATIAPFATTTTVTTIRLADCPGFPPNMEDAPGSQEACYSMTTSASDQNGNAMAGNVDLGFFGSPVDQIALGATCTLEIAYSPQDYSWGPTTEIFVPDCLDQTRDHPSSTTAGDSAATVTASYVPVAGWASSSSSPAVLSP